MFNLLIISMIAGFVPGTLNKNIDQGLTINLIAGALGGILAGQHSEMLLMNHELSAVSIAVQSLCGVLGGGICLVLTILVRDKLSQE